MDVDSDMDMDVDVEVEVEVEGDQYLLVLSCPFYWHCYVLSDDYWGAGVQVIETGLVEELQGNNETVGHSHTGVCFLVNMHIPQPPQHWSVLQ